MMQYAGWALLGACIPGLLGFGSTHPVAVPSTNATSLTSPASPMKIRIHLDDQIVTATLYDNATARDFATLLPLSLTLEDYAGTERVADLPRALDKQGAPDSMTPQAGDIAHYAPWGNLAIFVGNGVFSKDLLPLGKVTDGLTVLARPAPYKIRIERIEN
ncbi:hypothetical protein TKWG_19860 [Advenella kashmirensis WT001]|uniref:Cyclophilin-like domain-containing protein n=1 Tax=Advenella kashmirensis (strain DSM 17095 / LMG 22695 / WT001) TaxID=1036672 RepID=I3UFG6_ADVKW|nr:cyclophilin-like fold protein [Advenella kashmirensis]AFK63754.1 hypothetical protein TKWG_19860 [Advenella kashmirensis WT001]